MTSLSGAQKITVGLNFPDPSEQQQQEAVAPVSSFFLVDSAPFRPQRPRYIFHFLQTTLLSCDCPAGVWRIRATGGVLKPGAHMPDSYKGPTQTVMAINIYMYVMLDI